MTQFQHCCQVCSLNEAPVLEEWKQNFRAQHPKSERWPSAKQANTSPGTKYSPEAPLRQGQLRAQDKSLPRPLAKPPRPRLSQAKNGCPKSWSRCPEEGIGESHKAPAEVPPVKVQTERILGNSFSDPRGVWPSWAQSVQPKQDSPRGPSVSWSGWRQPPKKSLSHQCHLADELTHLRA